MALSDYFDREAECFTDHYASDRRFRERAAVWANLIERHAGASRSCLDLGCGPGVQARVAAARGLATIAIDLSAQMIARVPATPNLELRVGDFMTADLPPADLVLCSSVLEYAESLDKAVARIATLVREDGILLASLPNPQSLYRRAERIAFRATRRPAYRCYVGDTVSLEEARVLFAAYGLRCDELVYFARFAPLLRDELAANLAVLVLAKSSKSATSVAATSASS